MACIPVLKFRFSSSLQSLDSQFGWNLKMATVLLELGYRVQIKAGLQSTDEMKWNCLTRQRFSYPPSVAELTGLLPSRKHGLSSHSPRGYHVHCILVYYTRAQQRGRSRECLRCWVTVMSQDFARFQKHMFLGSFCLQLQRDLSAPLPCSVSGSPEGR